MNTDNKVRKPSIKRKITTCFTVFILVAILFLLLCQFFLFDCVYKIVRTSELYKAMSFIESTGEKSFYTKVKEAADEYSLCIKVIAEDGETLYSGNCLSNCIIHDFKPEHDQKIASLVKADKDQKFLSMLTSDEGGNFYSEEVSNALSIKNKSCVLFAKCCTYNDNEVIVLLSTLLEPTSAIKESYTILLALISVLLIIAAILTSLFISRKIASPIIRINKEAKNLSKGKYERQRADYREACELNDTLIASSDELSKVDSLRRELIANVSHDLRTPLTMIKGRGELMRDIPGEMNEENLNVLLSECERLSSLVSDILDLSKIESGNKELNKEVFSLTDSIKEAISSYKALSSTDGYKIYSSFDKNAKVFGDRTMIMQAFYNLFTNAMTYTGSDKKIKITQITDKDKVRIEVSDTGNGISPDELKDIWERYYRSNENHKRSAIGSGLGLSIVRSIISLHEGKYGVRSAKGKGSTFYFELPLHKDSDL